MCMGYFCTNCGLCGKGSSEVAVPAECICMGCNADLEAFDGNRCPICGTPIFAPAGYPEKSYTAKKRSAPMNS